MPVHYPTNHHPYMPRFAALLMSVGLMLSLVGCAGPRVQTHLLVMGGGGAPTNNQISLEKNIRYFHRIAGRLGWDDASRDVFFACGNDRSQDDVQYLAAASDEPSALRMIDALIGPRYRQSKAYRPHDLGSDDWPEQEIETSPEHIANWFDNHTQAFGPDDRVVVYFTGHGSKGPKDNAQNTGLHLWSKKKMPMQPFVGHLDKLNKQTPVVLVMVQCYSGGFANVIFNEGNPDKGLSEHNRCGFFASVHNRTAAGCTPHVNEADYKEYSSYFWAALSGEDRLGEPIDRPDYNDDGETSYLEAHAYAMIHSDSVDLSMSTTDRLVRALVPDSEENQPGQLTADSDYRKLLASADPARRAILDGLSERLKLTGEDRLAEAKTIVEATKKERDELKKKSLAAYKAYSEQRKPLIEMLKGRWPDLADKKKRGQARAQVVEDHITMGRMICQEEAFAKTFDRIEDIHAIKEKQEALATTRAHAERFVYTCQSVVKIDTLKRFGEQADIDAYTQLLAREMASPGS